MHQLLTEWNRAAVTLRDQLGRNPTDEEIATSLSFSEKKIGVIKKAIRSYGGTPPNGLAERERPVDETLVDQRASDPDAGLILEDDLCQVAAMLGTMDEREATILRLRFGLDDEEPKTLKEIGILLGLTRERVRQIESEALNELGRLTRAG
jgi:RNA polymerase primary sigma factor